MQDLRYAARLHALNLPLRRGRAIEPRDTASAPFAAVVNEALAHRLFLQEDAIGKQIRVGNSTQWRTIVGVTATVAYGAGSPERPLLYLPYLQFDYAPDTIAVRTAAAPASVARAVRAVIRAMEPRAPVVRMETMNDDLAGMVASPRFYTFLLGIFAATALALAALGVYGVVNFAVSLRTHEIGVRMALGATARDVLRSVIRQAATLAFAGAATGIAASLAATRLLLSTDLLFHVKPSDPMTFASVPAVLFATALAASWLPARRATKIDPAEALRYE